MKEQIGKHTVKGFGVVNMNRKTVKQELIKLGFSPEVAESGIQKYCRWMVKAFGAIDWDEESPVESAAAFCKETLKKPNGKNTFNRGF